MINTLLVDDEKHALETMSILLSEYPQIDIVGSSSDPLEAIQMVYNLKVDLLFIDVEMKGLNGIETLTKIREFNTKLIVVFVTAYENYTDQAIKLNVFNYLLKPIERFELWEIIKNISTLFPLSIEGDETFLVTHKGDTAVVKKAEIAHLCAEGSYTHVHLIDGTQHVVTQNIGKFILGLDLSTFAKVNRSYYIKKSFIVSFHCCPIKI